MNQLSAGSQGPADFDANAKRLAVLEKLIYKKCFPNSALSVFNNKLSPVQIIDQ